MTFEPIEHEPDDETVHTSSFWADLNRHAASPRFRRGYEKQTQRLTQADASRPSFPRRFWRSLTGHRDVVPAAALDAAYRERAHLVALLAAWRASHIGYNDPAAPDWAVVTIELPTGQACWHIAPDDLHLFAHVRPTPRHAPGWDGHTTDEKYRRIDQFAAQLAEGPF